MVALIDAERKTQNFQSKYHVARKKIETRYRFLQGKVISKFHRENNNLNQLRDSLNRLIEKSAAPYLIYSDSKKISSDFTAPSSKLKNYMEENIDWTRGRFKGKTQRIIVQNGQIIKKIFLTPQGNIISVHRKDLGFFVRLSMR